MIKIFVVTIIFLVFLIIYFSVFNVTIPIMMISAIATLLSSIVALSIPFIMNEEEKKANLEEEKRVELKTIELILKRLKQYFKYILEHPKDIYAAHTFPFFKYLTLTNANLLLKIGIEFNIYKREGTEYNHLFIIDKYQIHMGDPIQLRIGGQLKEITATKELFEKILTEMLDYAKNEYSLELEPKIVEFV